ncbi:MAG TPA: fused MFS/spermidine synthase, partial [Thermoanaerobaculia bacterium]|nr:fused MFS/spermidine synthase [Thermoanaerobaculia bacterium]
MPAPRLRSVVQILLALFAATGFIGLVAEQVYQKLLGTLVGASTPAAATVLAAYFGGLTLGSAGYDRWLRRRVGNPILAYAVLEGGVAALLVVTVLLFDRLLILFAPFLALARHSEAGLLIARLIVAAVWVVPPTFLMGASLPAIADSIAMLRLPSRHRLVALFYTINLVGAIVGSVAAPYIVFPMLGLDGALTICAALGAVVALTAQRLARSYSVERWQLRESPATVSMESSRGARSVILLLAFSSGFIFFALETLWVHLLAAVIGNSVYAFATMLTVVLIGLGIGSGISVLILPPAQTTSWTFLGGVLFSSGLALTVTHGLWPTIPHSLALVGRDITSFGAGEFLRFRHALAVVLLPAALLGIWFPTLFRLPDFPKQRLGDFVGKTYAANAMGCVIGALGTSFLLLPRFGSDTLLSVFAALLIVSGALLAVWRRRAVWPVAVAASLAGLVILNLPSWDRLRLTSGEHVYFSENAVRPDSQLLYFREDAAGGITTVVASTDVVNGRPYVLRTLLTNGKFQGNDGGEKTAQASFGMIPGLMTRDFNDVLVIGAGTGATADIVHTLGFKNVRIAEIAPPIIDAARREFSGLNHHIFDQP